MTGDYMSIEIEKYILVPKYRVAPQGTVVHHTEHGAFNMTTHLEEHTDEGDVWDDNGKLVVEPPVMYYVWVYVYYNRHVVQKHQLWIVDDMSRVATGFDRDEATAHSLAIHDKFDKYLEGVDSNYPVLRAFGWHYVPSTELIAIKMQEQRLLQIACQEDDFDLDLLHIMSLDNNDASDVQLSSSVTDFIDTLDIDSENYSEDDDENLERPLDGD